MYSSVPHLMETTNLLTMSENPINDRHLNKNSRKILIAYKRNMLINRNNFHFPWLYFLIRFVSIKLSLLSSKNIVEGETIYKLLQNKICIFSIFTKLLIFRDIK